MNKVQTMREEIIRDLERSIIVHRNDDGSYDVSLGDGTIKFTINERLKE